MDKRRPCLILNNVHMLLDRRKTPTRGYKTDKFGCISRYVRELLTTIILSRPMASKTSSNDSPVASCRISRCMHSICCWKTSSHPVSPRIDPSSSFTHIPTNVGNWFKSSGGHWLLNHLDDATKGPSLFVQIGKSEQVVTQLAS